MEKLLLKYTKIQDYERNELYPKVLESNDQLHSHHLLVRLVKVIYPTYMLAHV